MPKSTLRVNNNNNNKTAFFQMVLGNRISKGEKNEARCLSVTFHKNIHYKSIKYLTKTP